MVWRGHTNAPTTSLAACSHGLLDDQLADVYLTRARLFRDRTARDLLADLRTRGYHRHDDMLADTEAAAEHWPSELSG